MKSDKLIQNHISATYFNQRIGLVSIAFAFPILLWVGGAIQAVEIQNSMSAYFHADPIVASLVADATPDDGVMRSWFVGTLFTVGAILYLYKGYSRWSP